MEERPPETWLCMIYGWSDVLIEAKDAPKGL